MRGKQNTCVADTELIRGRYYYVVISRKTQLKYEFVAEYIGNDFKHRPTFVYQSILNEQLYKWHTRTSDMFYNLLPAGGPLPADLLAAICERSVEKTEEKLEEKTEEKIKEKIEEPARRCCIM